MAVDTSATRLAPADALYEVPGLPFPQANPPKFPFEDQDVEFDESIHLALSEPEWIKPLITDEKEREWHFPITKSSIVDDGFPGLAFSSSFQILSPEGIQEIKKIIYRNKGMFRVNERRPKSMRGLGYRSKFIRDLAYSPKLLEHLSKMVGKPIWPQNNQMNVGQVNIGSVGDKRRPENWHLDSIPYVVVLILSDTEGMVGGELQVARLKDPHEALRRIKSGTLTDEFITTADYANAGAGIFMQGSRIAHAVTPVLEAKEDRIALVNSYQTLCPFEHQHYIFRSFKYLDPTFVLPTEVARSMAWQARGQLAALVEEKPVWGEEGKQRSIEIMSRAISTLEKAKAWLSDAPEEEAPFLVNPENFAEMKRLQDVGFTDCGEGEGDRGDSTLSVPKRAKTEGRPDHEPANYPYGTLNSSSTN